MNSGSGLARGAALCAVSVQVEPTSAGFCKAIVAYVGAQDDVNGEMYDRMIEGSLLESTWTVEVDSAGLVLAVYDIDGVALVEPGSPEDALRDVGESYDLGEEPHFYSQMLDGTWVAQDRTFACTLEYYGQVYITSGNVTRFHDGGSYKSVNMWNGEGFNYAAGSFELSDGVDGMTIELRPHSGRGGFTLRYENGMFVSEDMTLERVPWSAVQQFEGEWSNQDASYSFEDGMYKKKTSRESYWGRFFVLSASEVLMGVYDDDLKAIPYGIAGGSLNLDGTVVGKMGEDSSASALEKMNQRLIGAWRSQDAADGDYADEFMFDGHGYFAVKQVNRSLLEFVDPFMLEEGIYTVVSASHVVAKASGNVTYDLFFDEATGVLDDAQGQYRLVRR